MILASHNQMPDIQMKLAGELIEAAFDLPRRQDRDCPVKSLLTFVHGSLWRGEIGNAFRPSDKESKRRSRNYADPRRGGPGTGCCRWWRLRAPVDQSLHLLDSQGVALRLSLLASPNRLSSSIIN
jgi:hypothetical protein